jgi:hypothetical protein
MSQPFSAGALVVTSIARPNAVLQQLAREGAERGVKFFVVGDSKSPADFSLEGCDYYGLERQRGLPFQYARLCQERSYTRKNIGYLLAMERGAQFIVETDDDNFPKAGFWDDRDLMVTGDFIARPGWVNAYSYFSSTLIYPRGFPIELLAGAAKLAPARGETRPVVCPIQQGLADGNPDVDAIYRMLLPLPLDFDPGAPIILGARTWCPFNSQNTTVFRDAFLLLYLPTYCSFRMTDIWRSFVAQRILWASGWNVAFHAATVCQERNEHNLLHDFADEVPGYLNNVRIGAALDDAKLTEGPEAIAENLLRCYQILIELGVIAEKEMPLLEAWLSDLANLLSR